MATIMKIDEIRNMSVTELEKEISRNKHELLQLKIQTSSGQSKETSKISQLRKLIARMQTVKNELTKSAN
jgi:ribosomal protein L29